MAINSYQEYIRRKDYSAEEMTDRFLKKYEASAGLSSRKLYYKRLPIRYQDWLNTGGPIPFHQEIEKEPMVEMYIPQHRFKEMVESERRMEEVGDENYRLRHLEEQLHNERMIREKNPVLQKAWEKYQMLLGMVR